MQLINIFSKEICFSLYASDIFSKYTSWVIPLKDKKVITITNAFQKFLKASNSKPKKIGVDKGSESYNSSTKSWIEKNDIEIFSKHNEGKSVFGERSIRILRNKSYKYMTSISKNVHIDKSDDIVNK